MPAVEAMPSQVTQATGFQEPLYFAPSQTDLSLGISETEIAKPPTFSHPLQERISREWRPLLLEKGEGSPARRLDVLKQSVDKFGNLVGQLSADEIDGDPDSEIVRLLARKASYIKLAAIDLVTPMKIDAGSFGEHKTLDTMPIKYPEDIVYGLVRSGMPPLEAMAHLKRLYMEGKTPIPMAYQMMGEEIAYRVPRNPDSNFKDALQDVADTWQRRAFGMYLRASDRIPNMLGEAQELIDEFDGMTDDEINSFATNNKVVTAYEKLEGDPMRNKLASIGGEAGDVIIGVDGFTAGMNRDQAIDANAALNRQIWKYRKTKRLVGVGYPEPEAMRLLHDVEERKSRGLRLPLIRIPAAVPILFGL
jgi:hypothetical protein